MALDPRHWAVHEDAVALPPWLRRTADGRVVKKVSAGVAAPVVNGRSVGRGGDGAASSRDRLAREASCRPAPNINPGGTA